MEIKEHDDMEMEYLDLQILMFWSVYVLMKRDTLFTHSSQFR